MCVPPYSAIRGYVARILGFMGGAGDASGGGLAVRLVRWSVRGVRHVTAALLAAVGSSLATDPAPESASVLQWMVLHRATPDHSTEWHDRVV